MEHLQGTGYFAAPNAIFNSGLTAEEMLVILYLHRCAGSDGSSWPSFNTIAKATDISRRTAIAAVKGLKEKGWLVSEARKSESGAFTSNAYRICPPSAGGALGSAGSAPPLVQVVHPKDNPCEGLSTPPTPPAASQPEPGPAQTAEPAPQTRSRRGSETPRKQAAADDPAAVALINAIADLAEAAQKSIPLLPGKADQRRVLALLGDYGGDQARLLAKARLYFQGLNWKPEVPASAFLKWMRQERTTPLAVEEPEYLRPVDLKRDQPWRDGPKAKREDIFRSLVLVLQQAEAANNGDLMRYYHKNLTTHYPDLWQQYQQQAAGGVPTAAGSA